MNGIKMSKMSDDLMSDTVSNAKHGARKNMMMNSGLPDNELGEDQSPSRIDATEKISMSGILEQASYIIQVGQDDSF